MSVGNAGTKNQSVWPLKTIVMQIKDIHGKSYAVISEDQLCTADGLATITNCIPIKFISEIIKIGTPLEYHPIYMVTFISFQPSPLT
jgi:hypothetical protein